MTKADLDGLLTSITEKAKGLRDAGVTSLSIGDITIALSPSDPPPEPKGEDIDQGKGPLDDPMTFGRRTVPGRRRGEHDQ